MAHLARYLWLSAYVLAVLLANVFLDNFIPLPGFGLFSIGSIFFATVFTLRDRLHRYGLPTVMSGISLALLITTVYGHWVAQIPSRFLLASFTAIALSELADTAVFERLRQHPWHVKVLSSNAVSVPLDSSAFTLLAFAGMMSVYDIAQIIFADICGKYLIAAALAFVPWIKTKTDHHLLEASRV